MSSYHTRGNFLIACVVVGVSLLLFVVGSQTAYADPHAIFYTAIGQQQLFFNVLAALNQADYVEPAEPTTGTPAGNSRKELLEKRETAGFGRVEDRPVSETETELASILTRGVTLEGVDLWSAYLAIQFARESDRRNATDELARIYCDRSFGRVGCSDSPAHRLKNTAFISDPLAWEQEVFSEGVLGALLSGTDEDAQLRQDRVNDTNKLRRKKPRAYSRYIAQLRQQAGAPGTPERDAVERRIAKAASAFIYQGLDTKVYDNIEYVDTGNTNERGESIVAGELKYSWWNEPGKINLNDGPPGYEDCRGRGSLCYTRLTHETDDALDQIDMSISQEAMKGADFIKSLQKYLTVDGAIADVAIKEYYVTECYNALEDDEDPDGIDEEDPDCHTDGNPKNPFTYDRYRNEDGSVVTAGDLANLPIGELVPIIESPAHAKIGMTEALADTIGDIDQNLIYAPPIAEKIPGEQRLVGPKNVPEGEGSGGPGAVSGATDVPIDASGGYRSQDTQARQGRVLQATATPTPPPVYPNWYEWYRYEDTNSLHPDTNPIAPHLEEGILDSLKALTGDRYIDPTGQVCGFCTFLDDLITSGGWDVIIDDINNDE